MNQFPVKSGTRISVPEDDLAKEEPLLLNPYKKPDHPALNFAPTLGTVEGTDEAGKSSVIVYSLLRDELNTDRRSEQEFVRLKLKNALGTEDHDGLADLLTECKNGTRKYSCAALAEINDYLKKMELLPISV
jgi:hypothetical protein